MTPEKNWQSIEIDHVKPICMFDVSKDEELKEAFSWENTQQKSTDYNFLDYQLQFIKPYRFLKLSEEGRPN